MHPSPGWGRSYTRAQVLSFQSRRGQPASSPRASSGPSSFSIWFHPLILLLPSSPPCSLPLFSDAHPPPAFTSSSCALHLGSVPSLFRCPPCNLPLKKLCCCAAPPFCPVIHPPHSGQRAHPAPVHAAAGRPSPSIPVTSAPLHPFSIRILAPPPPRSFPLPSPFWSRPRTPRRPSWSGASR